MTKIYKDVHEFFRDKSKQLLTLGAKVKSLNPNNQNSLKEGLIELPHQFFGITDPSATVFNYDSFKSIPWWMIGEIITEMLNINPPIMTRYREDLIDSSYKMMDDGTIEYTYGSRWKEFNQIDNVIKKLKSNPTSKRALITTWMPYDSDVNRQDVPCNINYMFLPRDGKLDMTATIRSNDIMRGSKYDYALAGFIQQSIASLSGLQTGELFFLINSLHVYEKDLEALLIAHKESRNLEKKAVCLKLEDKMDIDKYYHDLRHIKKAEESSYNSAFDYTQKNIHDINYSLFRDLARVIAIRNSKFVKNLEWSNKFYNEIENEEMRRWMK